MKSRQTLGRKLPQVAGESVGTRGQKAEVGRFSLGTQLLVPGGEDRRAAGERSGDHVPVLSVDGVGSAVKGADVDDVVFARAAHLTQPSADGSGVESWGVRSEVAFDLDERVVRHDWLVEPEVEGGQEEVAGQDRDEDVGIPGRNQQRHHS